VGQYNLATFYYQGHATNRDLGLAVKWFRASAEQGLAAAEANLALIYYTGGGVPVDYAEAAHWAKLAAEQGLPHAATNYGYMCEHGKGVPLDYVTAYFWYSRAIAAGDKRAVKLRKAVSRLLTPQQMERATTLAAADTSHPQNPTGTGGDGDVSLIQEP
jgi:TPR repeat protein